MSTFKGGTKIQFVDTPISFRISLGVLPSHRHYEVEKYLIEDKRKTFVVSYLLL